MSQFHGRPSNLSQRPDCNDYLHENKKILYTKDGFPVTTLSLSPLNSEVGHHHIFKHFSTFGTVHSVHILAKARNGFVFVTFTQFESAARALDRQFHIIAGHQTSVEIAKSEHQVEIELTNGTGTTLLDLNDDCLNEIFSLNIISISDLCSVVRTSVRLKGMAYQVFNQKHKKRRFQLFLSTSLETRRLFVTFSSLIEDLCIEGQQFVPKERKNILYLLCRCRTDSLKCLTVANVCIPLNTMTKLKTHFKDLKRLNVLARNTDSLPDQLNIIRGKTYPKLEEFEFNFCVNRRDLQLFIKRHQNLKRIRFSETIPTSLPMIVENCKNLIILRLFIYETSVHVDFQEYLKRLLVLDDLRVLHIRGGQQMFVSLFIQELNYMKSLKVLRLQDVYADNEFLPALSKLKKIRELSLINCRHLLPNFELLGKIKQLTYLRIESSEDVYIDGLLLIESLPNLKFLSILMKTFKIDKQMYLKIVDVVNGRPEKSLQSLEIYCLANGVGYFDLGVHPTVKLNRMAVGMSYGMLDY